eukprot:31197_5
MPGMWMRSFFPSTVKGTFDSKRVTRVSRLWGHSWPINSICSNSNFPNVDFTKLSISSPLVPSEVAVKSTKPPM